LVTICGGTFNLAFAQDEFSGTQTLRGNASVLDAPALRGALSSPGVRTTSLSSGLGKNHFGIGSARTGSLDALMGNAPSQSLAGTARTGRLDTLVGNATSDQLFGRASKLTTRTRDLLLKTFAQMTCVEYNELSANYYTVQQNYHPVSLDRTIALPGFSGGNVQCFSDGKRIIAIDPHSLETWVIRAGADVTSRSNWRKLNHIKN
jgi:hypothetical protein